MERRSRIQLFLILITILYCATGCVDRDAGSPPAETPSTEQAPARADTAAASTGTRSPAELLGDTTLRDAGRTVQFLGLRVLIAVVILIMTVFVIRGVAFLLERLADRNAGRRLFYKRIVPIARIVIWSISIYVVLAGIFQLDATSLLAAGAALGVAIGFAAQDILKNIFGGLVIIFDQPFQVGDKIAVGETYGEVVAIGLRSTRITTPDDNLVSVPNSQIVGGQVANANAGALDCQVVTDLYLPGWVDEAKAKKIAYEAAASSRHVYLNKPIIVLVNDKFDKEHLTHIRVKAYVLDTRFEFLLQSEITERARMEFRKQGLLTPWYGHDGASPVRDSARVLESNPSNPDTHALQ